MTGPVAAKRWLLLDGDRHVVALLVLAGVFLVLVGLGYAGVVGVESDAVRGVAGGLIPGLFTFLSIVLAINQLVLSQEFGSAAEVRSRTREIEGFRHDVEAAADAAPSPVLPTAFLAVVVRTLESKAVALRDQTPADLDAEPRAAIDAFAGTVVAETRHMDERLSRRDPGRINAILSVLEYSDSRQRHEARRIRAEYGDALPRETRRMLSELIDAFELFSVASTHFRTTYTQRVLARLSRLLLYVGIPALLAAIVLHLLRPTTGVALLDRYRLVVVSGLLAVALSPLAVLFAYILRIAAVSERTIAIGPFVSRPGTVDQD